MMRVKGLFHPRGRATVAAIATFAVLALPASAVAFEPSKWVLSFHVGWGVNKNGATPEDRNECTTAPGEECQPGTESSAQRGFLYPESVAVSPETGNAYIADKLNYRVQVLDPNGKFVLMFGWNVNKTKVGGAATQQEKDVCTAASGDECGRGERGTGLAGQIFVGEDIAIDPSTGNVYVFEVENSRVEEFSATGEFLLMFGGKVNKNGGNVCTKVEESECQAGAEGTGDGEFTREERNQGGNLLTVGPADHLLYVGDQGRIQKFEANGKWAGNVSLAGLSPTGLTKAIAVDTSGNVFVVNNEAAGVHEYDKNDVLQPCVIDGGEAGNKIKAIALDAHERLGVISLDFATFPPAPHGRIYEAHGPECGKTVGGEIVPPSGKIANAASGLAFSLNAGSEDQLYIVIAEGFFSEIEAYKPVIFPEVSTCATTEVLFIEAEPCGDINPLGLEAKGFFKYGTFKPGTQEIATEERTPIAFSGVGEALALFHFGLTELEPNQVYWDEAFAEAEIEGKVQEAGGPPLVTFHTSTPPPEITGAPETVAVNDQRAVFTATVNPEHAPTRYHFEYAPCADEGKTFVECGEAHSLPDLQSAQYGTIGVTQEISGLAPQSTYAFRLVADNQFEYEGSVEGGQTEGEEAHFTTSSSAVPGAQTGEASAITATSATIAGTVDPDGQPATYVFELGVYDGANTQYGVVFSGPAGTGVTPIEKALALSGLQPATVYAYRIGLKSGYVKNASGETVGEAKIFQTLGVPILIPPPPVLGMLPIPSKFPEFPKPPTKCKHGFKRDKHGKCVKARVVKKGKSKKASSRGRTRTTGRGKHK